MSSLHRPASGALCALSILLALACNGGDSGADSATPPSTTARLAETGATPARKGPKKLKMLPEDGAAEWQAYIADLDWSTHSETSGERGCWDAPNTHSPDCILTITAVDGAILVGPEDYEATGRVIARILNKGPKTEALFGIPGNTTAYLHVMQRNDKKIVGRVVSADGRVLASASGVREHRFRRCDHGSSDTLQLASVARFAECGDIRPEFLVTKGGPRTEHNRPAWLTCAQGCCVVEGDSP